VPKHCIFVLSQIKIIFFLRKNKRKKCPTLNSLQEDVQHSLDATISHALLVIHDKISPDFKKQAKNFGSALLRLDILVINLVNINRLVFLIESNISLLQASLEYFEGTIIQSKSF
jgi:hypothetical protein